jgi:hypothetical protein
MMTEYKYADILFEEFNSIADRMSKEIRTRIFSQYREIQFSPEQYKQLQPLIRKELDSLIYQLLGTFENVGCVLPEGAIGYEILKFDVDQDGRTISVPIREGAFPDYCDLWDTFLNEKLSK